MNTAWKQGLSTFFSIWKLPFWQWVVIILGCFSLMWLFNIAFFLQTYLLATNTTQNQVSPTMVFFQSFLPGEFSRRITWIVTIPIGLFFIKKFPLRQQESHSIAKYLSLQTALSLGFGILCAVFTALHAQISVPIFWKHLPDGVPSVGRLLLVHFTLVSGFVASVALYWLMVFAVQAVQNFKAFRYERERRKDVETELVQAQLYALQSQLQPHFLFNALNSVSSLMFEDIHRADRMIARLGEFLRISLNFHKIQMIPLSEEIGFVERYLEIEEMRFEERLRVQWFIPEDTQLALVPAFLLQPLVENAIKHGIAPLNTGGSIVISAWTDKVKKLLSLQVMNVQAQGQSAFMKENGLFLNNSFFQGIQNETKFHSLREGGKLQLNYPIPNGRIGLKNTQSRLEKLFKGSYFLDFGYVTSVAVPSIHENSTIGFFVNIGIPFQTA